MEVKKCSKTFFKILEKQEPAKSKQYLNYILIIINQNILIILRKISSLQRNFMKHLTTKRQLSKLLLLIFAAKLLREIKFLMNNLTFLRQNIFRWAHKIFKFSNKRVLLLEQESDLSNVWKMIKNILQIADLYATILKNWLDCKEKLDTIIGENHSPSIKNRIILHTLSMWHNRCVK